MVEALKPFQRDILTLRSHQWKYIVDSYAGCSYRCQYCLYGSSENFFKNSQPLPNIVDRVRLDLDSLGSNKPIIYLGATADAYQPRERGDSITRQLMELFVDKEMPVMILTKSPLILRDIDLLQELNKNGKILVQLTILTTNATKSRILEKGTPDPAIRLDTAKKLTEAGIPVHMHVSPFIPDLYENNELENTVSAIKANGGRCIYSNIMGIRYSYKEPLIQAFRKIDPELERKIADTYPHKSDGEGVYSPYSDSMITGMARFREICINEQINFVCETIPQFTSIDPKEFRIGIFRFGAPAVYQMMQFWTDKGNSPVDWKTFKNHYLSRFPAVDEDYLKLVKDLWDTGELFENTVICPETHEGMVRYWKGSVLNIDHTKVVSWK